jgi:hypothetical protein
VTVFLGPIRAEGTTDVQRVTYENRDSMKVVNVDAGRTGQGSAASPNSAEGIMRKTHKAGPAVPVDRASERIGPWTGGTEEPQDREIAGE